MSKWLAHYDRPATLFYVDPPYYGKKLYRYNLSDAKFATLEERLRGLRGKFILSLNDVPEVRAQFKRYYIRQVELS